MSLGSRLKDYSEAELVCWLHLRALEWAGLPIFVSQPIVPVLLIIYPWTSIVVVLACIDFCWCFIGYSFVNVHLVNICSWLVIILKWPSTIGSSAYLALHGHYGLALAALAWPWLAAIVGAPARYMFAVAGARRELGRIEFALRKQVGYGNEG